LLLRLSLLLRFLPEKGVFRPDAKKNAPDFAF